MIIYLDTITLATLTEREFEDAILSKACDLHIDEELMEKWFAENNISIVKIFKADTMTKVAVWEAWCEYCQQVARKQMENLFEKKNWG